MPTLHDFEVPVAYAQYRFMQNNTSNPFVRYSINYWIAFNNCYVTLYERDGKNHTGFRYEKIMGRLKQKPMAVC